MHFQIELPTFEQGPYWVRAFAEGETANTAEIGFLVNFTRNENRINDTLYLDKTSYLFFKQDGTPHNFHRIYLYGTHEGAELVGIDFEAAKNSYPSLGPVVENYLASIFNDVIDASFVLHTINTLAEYRERNYHYEISQLEQTIKVHEEFLKQMDKVKVELKSDNEALAKLKAEQVAFLSEKN